MRLRLVAISTLTILVLLIALYPVKSVTQAQQSVINETTLPEITRSDDLVNQFWSPDAFPILGLEPIAER